MLLPEWLNFTLRNININVSKLAILLSIYFLYKYNILDEDNKMAASIFGNETLDISVNDIEALKNKLDYMDRNKLVRSFSKTRDPIELAFEHIDNAPLNKLAHEFLKDIFVDAVCFISKVL